MKKFDLGDCSFQSDNLAEIISVGLMEVNTCWVKDYKTHGSRTDVPLEEILFHDDSKTVPGYLLYGEETHKGRMGQTGSKKNPWILTLGGLIDGLSQLKTKDFKRYFKFVLNKWNEADTNVLIQYSLFGEQVFRTSLQQIKEEGLKINETI